MPVLLGSLELGAAVAALAVATALGHVATSLLVLPLGTSGPIASYVNGRGEEQLPFAVSCFLLLILAIFFVRRRVRFVGQDEMLYVELLTQLKIIRGPCTVAMPILLKNWKQKRALTLNETEHCIVRNNLTGASRLEKGPQMVFLKPYDKILGASSGGPGGKEFVGGKKDAISLKANEFVRLVDRETGKITSEVITPRPITPTFG